MSESSQRDQVIQRIKYSTDPNEIMKLVLNRTKSVYYRSLKQSAATAMVDLVRQDSSRSKFIGLKVVKVVVELMCVSNVRIHQELGCDILWRLSVDTKYGEKPFVACVRMMDEIEDVVSNAIQNHGIPRVGWIRHAETILDDIKSIREQRK